MSRPTRPGASAAFLLALATVWPLATPIRAQDAPDQDGPNQDAQAQQAVVEEQIPFDAGGAVFEVGPDLRERLEILPGAPTRGTARLFRAEDGSVVLEIAYQEDGRIVRERRPLQPQDLASLRERVARQLAELGPDASGDPRGDLQDGRVRLILWQSALGLGFYGWALPDVLGLEDERTFLAGYLITSGLSFLVPYLLTRDAPVTEAQGRMSGWGGTRGIAYGLLAAEAAQGVSDYGDDESLGTALAASFAGSYLGYKIPEWADLDEGTAQLWSSMADLGTLAGFATAHAGGFYDDELVERQVDDGTGGGPIVIVEPQDKNLRAGHLLTLGSAAAGMVAGRWLGGRDSYTRGDVYALRSAAWLGAQVALPLAELASGGADRGKHYSAGAVLGGLAGTWAGSRFLRGQDWTSGEGLLLNAGQVAGSLGALGVTWIFETDTDANELAFTLAQAAGGIAGLALTYRALGGPSRSSSEGRASGVDIRLNPVGILGIRGPRLDPSAIPPLLTIRF